MYVTALLNIEVRGETKREVVGEVKKLQI